MKRTVWVHGTQGGGDAMEIKTRRGYRYIFVARPPYGFKVGDFVPVQWSIGPGYEIELEAEVIQ